MIIERTTFHLHFGKAKEAIEIWKEIGKESRGSKNPPELRMMSDLSGPSYTLELEIRITGFNEIGLKNYQWMTNEKMVALYQKFIPLCREAHREYFHLEDEIRK